MTKRVKWLAAAAVAAVVVFVGGPFVYINLIKEDAPPALSFADVDAATTTTAGSGGATTLAPATTDPVADTSTATAAGAATTAGAAVIAATVAPAAAAEPAPADGIDGTWTATDASVVGYRVKEVLFGQTTEGVGRTSTLTGSLTVQGATVSAAEFTVDMATVVSDDSRRDRAFVGRIMDVATHPNATFRLSAPIDLGGVPADREEVAVRATGELTLKGSTNSVTFDLVARRNGPNVEVNGSIPVVFADYGIGNPSIGGITTEDEGQLEFLLVFAR